MGITVDKELQTELRYALRKPRNFVFAPGAKLENHFLRLSKKKIPKPQIQAARLESGGSKVYWGACHPEGKTVVFETTKKVSDTLTKALRVTARKIGGLSSIDVVIRQNVGLVETDFADEEEQDESAGETDTAPSEEGFAERARQLIAVRMKTIDKGLVWIKSAKPRGAKQIVTALQRAKATLLGAETEKDFDLAVQRHDDVITLLRAAMKAAKKATPEPQTQQETEPEPQQESPDTPPSTPVEPWESRIKAAGKSLATYAKRSYADPKTVKQLGGLLKLAQSLRKSGDSERAEIALAQLVERTAAARKADSEAQGVAKKEFEALPAHDVLRPKQKEITGYRGGNLELIALRTAALKAYAPMVEASKARQYDEASALIPDVEQAVQAWDAGVKRVAEAEAAFEKAFKPHEADVTAALQLMNKRGLPPTHETVAKGLRKPGSDFAKARYEGRFEDARGLLSDVATKSKTFMDAERKLAAERKAFRAAEKKILGKSFPGTRDFAESMTALGLDRGDLKEPVAAVLAVRKAIDEKLKEFDYVGATGLLGDAAAAVKKVAAAKAAYDKARTDIAAAVANLEPRSVAANKMPNGVGTSSSDKLTMSKYASDFNDLYKAFDYIACKRVIALLTRAVEKLEAAQAKLELEKAAFYAAWNPVSGDYAAVENLYGRNKSVTKQVEALNDAYAKLLAPFEANDYPAAAAAVPALVKAMAPLLQEFPKQEKQWRKARKAVESTKKKWFGIVALTPALKVLDDETFVLWKEALALADDKKNFKGAMDKLAEWKSKVAEFLTAAAAHEKAAVKVAKRAEKDVSSLVKKGKLAEKSVTEKRQLLDALRGSQKMTSSQRKAQRAIYNSMEMDEEFLEEDEKKRTAIVGSLTDTPEKKVKLQDFLDNWSSKPNDEKLDLMRDAISAQCAAMGIDPPPEVVEILQEWENGLIESGYFDPSDGKIYINTHPDSSFNSGMETALDLAFHENSHNYQDELVKRLEPTHPDPLDPADPEYEQAVMFAMNDGRQGYVRGEEDFASYKKQPLEDHAHDNGPKTAKALLAELEPKIPG